MNSPQSENENRETPQGFTESQIEQMMRENGIERFDFDEAVGTGKELWNDEEFDEFLTWLNDSRQAAKNAPEKTI